LTWFESKLASIEALEGYEYSVQQDAKPSVKMDANENWNIPLWKIRSVMARVTKRVDAREYPDGVALKLCEVLARHHVLPAECFVPCSGADQAIDLLSQGFLSPGDPAYIITPTFSMYRLRATIAQANCVEVSMGRNFSLPVEEIPSGAKGVIFVCSPNNPTGNQFEKEEMLRLVRKFEGLIVLDEAYVEFARYSLIEQVAEFKNLAVLRTFSKAYGLAGLRLGYIAAHPSWARDFLEKIQYPYPVNVPAVEAALKLLGESLVKSWVSRVKAERGWLTMRLREIPDVTVVDSESNFVLASLPMKARMAHRRLLERGLATREVGSVLDLPNCLRITVGTRRMNKLLVASLRAVLGEG